MLRLRGDYLAIVTLGFGEDNRIFLNNLNTPINLTNGPQGIGGISPLILFGIDFSKSVNFLNIELSSLQLHYYLFLAMSIVIILIVNVSNTRDWGERGLLLGKMRLRQKLVE